MKTDVARTIGPTAEEIKTALRLCAVDEPAENYPCEGCYLYPLSKDGRVSTGRTCFEHLALDACTLIDRINTFAGSQLEKLLAEVGRLREAQRWIPVEERLPNHPFAVIICGPGYVSIDSYINGKWRDQFSEITHWMERPEPPAQPAKIERTPLGDGYFGIKNERTGQLEIYARADEPLPEGPEGEEWDG